MPQQDSVGSAGPFPRQAIDEQAAAHQSGVAEQVGYETLDGEEWMEDPEQLPRRPRRRLLGAGTNPVPIALLGVLLTACGFIGGVLVEKGEGSPASSTSSGTGLAARFRSLRGGGGASGAASGSRSRAGASGESPASFARPTVGTVAFLAGSTLYVTTAEGNTVKVATSHSTTVTKSVKTSFKGIHPGETVTVSGTTSQTGTVNAESITDGSSAGSGLAALFGAGAGAAPRSSGAGAGEAGAGAVGGGGGTGSDGAQPLFGGG